jgi:hypothetical protein
VQPLAKNNNSGKGGVAPVAGSNGKNRKGK